MHATKIADWADLQTDVPAYALVRNVDLVVIRHPDDAVSVMYGRCQHRGALLSDATVRSGRLTCGLHGSTYDARTGTNIHYKGADLKPFGAWVEDGAVWVNADEIAEWELANPQKYDRNSYQGLYAD